MCTLSLYKFRVHKLRTRKLLFFMVVQVMDVQAIKQIQDTDVQSVEEYVGSVQTMDAPVGDVQVVHD